MPTYEYQCPDGHLFEKLEKMSDKPRAKCPVCGKPATRKISGGAGLVFKGTGFYITDYGKDGKGPRKDGAEKAERAEKADKAEKPAPSGREGTEKPAASGPTSKEASSKSEGKADKAERPGKSGGKGKAASE
jgi:putative FmdB family regulatory protein